MTTTTRRLNVVKLPALLRQEDDSIQPRKIRGGRRDCHLRRPFFGSDADYHHRPTEDFDDDENDVDWHHACKILGGLPSDAFGVLQDPIPS